MPVPNIVCSFVDTDIEKQSENVINTNHEITVL